MERPHPRDHHEGRTRSEARHERIAGGKVLESSAYRILAVPICSDRDSLPSEQHAQNSKGNSVRSTVSRRLLAVAAVSTALAIPSGPASAAPVQLFDAADFFIPRPASATDQEGIERPIAHYDLAANGHSDLIGRTCEFTVVADNGDSVNVNNYAIIRTGSEESDVYETESEANVTTTVMEDATLVPGPTIQMFNVMVPGAGDIVGTSVDFTLFVDCAVPATTTSTTIPSTTSTTSPSPGPSTSTPTTAPDPSTSTTAAITTSTSEPGTSISDSTSTTIPATVTGTLPFTGSGAPGLGSAAVALMVLGGAGVVAARPRGRHSR